MKKTLLTLTSLITLATNTQAQVSFNPHVTYGAGSNPISVYSADFNGDGNMDVVTPYAGNNTVSVLLGSGTGTFAPQTTYAVGSYPYSVYSDDFNGDGFKDLVTANAISNNVSVLLGSGTGSFSVAVNYAIGSSPRSVYSADFNGDGKMDLVTANDDLPSTVSVLLGSASGTFAAQTTYAVGSFPTSVYSADFDSDGDMDIVTANRGSSNVSVLLGSGTGTFAPQTTYPVGTNPTSVYSADFDSDGDMDIVTANVGGNNVSVLLGSGTGSFSVAVNYAVGSSPRSVYSADFNGDGKMDLVTANYSDNNVSVLLGSGTGTFAPQTTYPVGTNPVLVYSADFNGDGKMDVVTANVGGNNVSVLLNTTPGAEALNFDGSNDYVNLGASITSTLSASNKITVEAWVKPATTTGNGCIVGNYNTALSGNLQFLLRRDGSAYTFWVNNGSGFTNVTAVATVTTAVWQHVAGTWDGSNIKIYVNGALSATTSYTGTALMSFTNSVWIGANVSNENFNGSIDEVRIWNRTLCQGEIQNNMSAQIGLPQTGLVAYYQFNEGFHNMPNPTATNLLNALGATNTGTLMNFALTNTVSNWVAPGAVSSSSTAPTFNPLHTATVTTTDVLCNGGNTGSATVSVSAGYAPYTYLWSTGATTSVITNQTMGVKTVTVTNACGGVTINTITITQPASAVSTSTSITNVSCFGGNTGSASIIASGGTSPYTYSWSTAATTSVITGQTAGVKTVTVTDGNSCTSTKTITITQPTALVTTTAVTNILCNGGSNGTASVSVSGGAGGYTYLWSTGAVTSVITGQMAGVKTVTVTDGNSCTSTKTITITQPVSLSTSISKTNVLCNGGSTGSATVTATGGTSPYTYSWSNGTTTSVINSVIVGVYTATVTDANSCTVTASGTITQPIALATSTAVTHILCNSGSTGSGTVTASGGTAGYTYLWNTGATTSTITGLMAGAYTATVTDANGCSSTSTVQINVTGFPTVLATTSSSLICIGETATLTASGANTYTWNTSQTTTVIAVSPTVTTTYTVTGTNANGCVNTATITQEVIICPGFNTAAAALNFDGIDDVVSVPTATNFPTGNSPYTLEAFIKPTGNVNGEILGWGNYGTGDEVNALRLDYTGNVYNYNWSSNDILSTNAGTIDLYDGNWHHVAATYDGTTKKIYIDGIVSNSLIVTGTLNIPTPTNFNIGVTAGIEYFKGGIDEVKVWSRALSETEIQTNKNCPLALPQLGLVAYYQFNQGLAYVPNPTVTTLTDLVSATNTGTLTNFTLNGSISNWALPGAVNALPTVLVSTSNTLLCAGQTATLTASGASTYNWNTSAITTVIAVSPTTTTVYTVTGTDANGCVNTTTITQDVSLCTGIKAVAEALEATIQVYPNPTNGIITIELATVNNNTKVELLNTLGQVLLSEITNIQHLTFNIHNYPAGVYFINVTANNTQQTIKVIKE